MRTLAWSRLNEFIRNGHVDTEETLRIWYKTAVGANWKSFADVRKEFKSADAVGDKLIFNIKGNSYRLIAAVNYPYGRLYIKFIGTHAEYDRLSKEDILKL